jgi:hypothetical protein
LFTLSFVVGGVPKLAPTMAWMTVPVGQMVVLPFCEPVMVEFSEA